MHCLAGLFVLCVLGVTTGQAAESASPATADPEIPGGLARVARRIEPDLKGDPERLSQYVNFFSREFGNDSRICAFDVTAERDTARHVKLRGFVEFPETRRSL